MQNYVKYVAFHNKYEHHISYAFKSTQKKNHFMVMYYNQQQPHIMVNCSSKKKSVWNEWFFL